MRLRGWSLERRSEMPQATSPARGRRRGLRGFGGPSSKKDRMCISVLFYPYSFFGFCELYSRHTGSNPTLAYPINILYLGPRSLLSYLSGLIPNLFYNNIPIRSHISNILLILATPFFSLTLPRTIQPEFIYVLHLICYSYTARLI